MQLLQFLEGKPRRLYLSISVCLRLWLVFWDWVFYVHHRQYHSIYVWQNHFHIKDDRKRKVQYRQKSLKFPWHMLFENSNMCQYKSTGRMWLPENVKCYILIYINIVTAMTSSVWISCKDTTIHHSKIIITEIILQ